MNAVLVPVTTECTEEGAVFPRWGEPASLGPQDTRMLSQGRWVMRILLDEDSVNFSSSSFFFRVYQRKISLKFWKISIGIGYSLATFPDVHLFRA